MNDYFFANYPWIIYSSWLNLNDSPLFPVWGLSVTIPSDVAQDMLDSIPLHSSMTFSNALVETQRAVIQLLAKRHSVMSGEGNEFTSKRLFF